MAAPSSYFLTNNTDPHWKGKGIMPSRQLYFGAFAIFLGLVLAGLFSGSANAFSRDEKDALKTTVRLNIADNAQQTSDLLRPQEFELHIGADKHSPATLQADNFYLRNFDAQSNPVEIGGVKLRF